MRSGSVSNEGKSGQIDNLESDDKADKKIDKDMELIFDDYLSKKMNREKQAEAQRKESIHNALSHNIGHKSVREQERIHGLHRDEQQEGKDVNDTRSEAVVGGVSNAQGESAAVEIDDSTAVIEKLEGIINHMVSHNLSESNMQVRISGANEASVDLALSRSKGQVDVFISSQSKQALTLVSNQLGTLEEHMRQQGHRNVHISVIG